MYSIDDVHLAKALEKEGCSISLLRVLAGRGDPREPGQIVADALTGWHNPDRVNAYFRLIYPTFNFYSNDAKDELEVLWQLRHSIVHTGGTITREDAAKVRSLRGYNDRKIVLGTEFFPAFARRFHIMVQLSVEGLEVQVRKAFRSGEDAESDDGIIKEVVGIGSPRKSWFRKEKK